MLNRLVQPFVLVVTAILTLSYAYIAWRLSSSWVVRILLAIPFVLVWIVPVVYWGRERGQESGLDHLMHMASYVSMAWLSFLFVLTLARDALLLVTMWSASLAHVHTFAQEQGAAVVLLGSLGALIVGAATALRGPRVREVDIGFPDLHQDLVGFRIAQISDLHVGRTIRKPYVTRVVELTTALQADMVVLTGDMVDGSVAALGRDVAPLEQLSSSEKGYFVLGNHDCYSGAGAWTAHFRKLGFKTLLNEHTILQRGAARMIVGGVIDPALRPGPEPGLAMTNAPPADFRLLLAHNPRIAAAAERAGFDLQLSGHTHAGQFFPWTLAVRLVHAPHVAGLSQEGRMRVYVSAGTGTWGPPVRFGTSPELTLIRLVRA